MKTCDLCTWTKVQRDQLMGKLQFLPIPKAWWDTISIELVVKLPESNGYDVVMNVVDSISKHSHLIPPNTTISALGAARLYLMHMWKHYGLPRQVVSDQGPQFLAE